MLGDATVVGPGAGEEHPSRLVEPNPIGSPIPVLSQLAEQTREQALTQLRLILAKWIPKYLKRGLRRFRLRLAGGIMTETK